MQKAAVAFGRRLGIYRLGGRVADGLLGGWKRFASLTLIKIEQQFLQTRLSLITFMHRHHFSLHFGLNHIQIFIRSLCSLPFSALFSVYELLFFLFLFYSLDLFPLCSLIFTFHRTRQHFRLLFNAENVRF